MTVRVVVEHERVHSVVARQRPPLTSQYAKHLVGQQFAGLLKRSLKLDTAPQNRLGFEAAAGSGADDQRPRRFDGPFRGLPAMPCYRLSPARSAD